MRWEGPGLNSCAHWLNWKCGIGLGAAREQVRVAHALKKLPKISDKFKTGELRYSKVRAMTRIATPENEVYLLIIARHSTAAYIERLVSSYRGVLNRQKAVSAEENREVTWYHDDDGSVVNRARLPAEAGEVVIKALELAEATKEKRGSTIWCSFSQSTIMLCMKEGIQFGSSVLMSALRITKPGHLSLRTNTGK